MKSDLAKSEIGHIKENLRSDIPMSDLRFCAKKHGKTPGYTSTQENKDKKEGWKSLRTLVRLLWRPAAPGLKPLRLPRARTCPGEHDLRCACLVTVCSRMTVTYFDMSNVLAPQHKGLTKVSPRSNALAQHRSVMIYVSYTQTGRIG